MLKIKEWKYNDMMSKVTKYGDKWMEFDSFKRDANSFDQVVIEDGYVIFEGVYEVVKESAKAMQISFAGAWTEWMPKSALVIA